METFGFSPQACFFDLGLLFYTGARFTGDRFGVTDTFDGFDRPFRCTFDVSGYQHCGNDATNPATAEPSVFRRDPIDRFDPHAVEVARRNGVPLGYIHYPRLFVIADIDLAMQKVRAVSVSPRLGCLGYSSPSFSPKNASVFSQESSLCAARKRSGWSSH